MKRDALFSPDGRYRYSLSREWDDEGATLRCIGLNPSAANEWSDDPTIAILVGFAARLGYGRLLMLNLFALVSSDPEALKRHPSPIGQIQQAVTLGDAYPHYGERAPGCLNENDLILLKETEDEQGIPHDVVAMWGANAMAPERALFVQSLLWDRRLMCLGLTKSGAPRHPLRFRLPEKLTVFREPLLRAEGAK